MSKPVFEKRNYEKETTMNRKIVIFALTIVGLAALIVTAALAAGQSDLAKIRSATAQYHRLEGATSAGYVQVPGLDHCFNNPGVGAMGFHYIQTTSLDLNLDPEKPEAMVYAPGPNGQLQLGAVEYIVPAEPWDKAGNIDPPVLLGRSLHLNKELGVYVLHAWIWKNNPAGMYEDWNPKVTCP
jgi:hypothetical protein